MQVRKWGVVLLGLLIAGIPGAGGQENSPRKEDEEAIRKTTKAFAKAFAAGDTDAIASMWTKDGEYISDSGDRLRGRKEIAEAFGEYFEKNKDRSVKLQVDSIRFLGKHTALEEGVMTTKSAKGKYLSTRYTVLHVREDGKWRIAAVREWEEVAPESKLQDLAWMIGDWVSKSKGSEVRMSYRWNENKTFILGQMTVVEGKKQVSTAKIVMGKDPSEEIVRSWVFHSDGSYGHGAWFKDGKAWAIDSASKLADGGESTATNVLTPISEDAFAWRSVERTVNGEALPDTTPVRVERVKK